MSLSDIFVKQSIGLNMEAETKKAAFLELIDLIMTAHPECNRDEILAAITNREDKMSTGIGSGIAVPHGYCQSVDAVAGAIGISRAGIDDYGSLDQKPVHVLFMLVMNDTSREAHLRVLNQVFTMANSEAINLIMSAKTTEEVAVILSRFC
ncbi:MAG: PTS sugar transporter subunit IIA [Treponema sp.]|jgi:mannitol/fructose-specific phosphotransferase system IIA component (Ntr-type)|nr:PTS sugar transporter subunit IIA [Treponema sp.]